MQKVTFKHRDMSFNCGCCSHYTQFLSLTDRLSFRGACPDSSLLLLSLTFDTLFSSVQAFRLGGDRRLEGAGDKVPLRMLLPVRSSKFTESPMIQIHAELNIQTSNCWMHKYLSSFPTCSVKRSAEHLTCSCQYNNEDEEKQCPVLVL